MHWERDELYDMRHKAKYISCGIFVIVILIIVGLIMMHPTYSKYASTNNPHEAINLREKYSNSPHLEYDFTYKSGCRQCDSVRSIVLPFLKHKREEHTPLLVLDANNKSLHRYMLHTGQTLDPTISIRYHGYLIYQYTGTNHHAIKELFSGIDPDNNKKFSERKPKLTIVRNDYNHQKSREPASDNLGF